jgi:hypothetical protein
MESEALEFICGHRDNPFYRKNEPANNSQPRACLSLAESPPPPPPFKLNRVFFIEKCVCFFSDSILVPFFFFLFDFEVQGSHLVETWVITKLIQRYGGKISVKFNCICLPTSSHLHLCQPLFLGKRFSHMLSLGGKI